MEVGRVGMNQGWWASHRRQYAIGFPTARQAVLYTRLLSAEEKGKRWPKRPRRRQTWDKK